MRYVGVLMVLVACSSSPGGTTDAKPSDAKPIDAMPDADPCANVSVTGCVTNGLVGLPFDGTTPWTLTGTATSFGQQTAVSQTTYVLRSGCQLVIANNPISTVNDSMVITDTHGGYSNTGEYPHPHSFYTDLCVSPADNALHYASGNMQTMPSIDNSLVGILTR